MTRSAVAMVLTVLAVATMLAAETNDVMLQIERLALAGEKDDRALVELIIDGIEKNQKDVSKVLVQRLNDKNLTEQQQAVYVWALGLSKDQETVGQIEALHGRNKSELVRRNCLRAFAAIGGRQAEAFLMATFDTTTDKEMRFNILNLLGQMQSEAALPKTEEVLKLAITEFYWQPIFVFGKMGDKATPFLLKKINDNNRNVRANSINVLGQWLIPLEAAKPLIDQFWVEKDAELRVMILGSLERTMPDITAMKAFFERVADKETEKEVSKFARETLDNMNKIKASVTTFAQKKQPSAEAFQREYTQLFKSAGKKGDYQTLGITSTADDETRLKALRERILQRDSDEAFNDYQKVNEIITLNRMLEATAGMKAVQPSAGGDGKPAPQP